MTPFGIIPQSIRDRHATPFVIRDDDTGISGAFNSVCAFSAVRTAVSRLSVVVAVVTSLTTTLGSVAALSGEPDVESRVLADFGSESRLSGSLEIMDSQLDETEADIITGEADSEARVSGGFDAVTALRGSFDSVCRLSGEVEAVIRMTGELEVQP